MLLHRSINIWCQFGQKCLFRGSASTEVGGPQLLWALFQWQKSASHAKFDQDWTSGSWVMQLYVQKTSNARPPFHLPCIKYRNIFLISIKAWHFSVKHHQTNNVGFWKWVFSICKYKFFQISKIWKVTKPNINKYFEIPRVQIQIGARNLKSWLITKYLSRTK